MPVPFWWINYITLCSWIFYNSCTYFNTSAEILEVNMKVVVANGFIVLMSCIKMIILRPLCGATILGYCVRQSRSCPQRVTTVHMVTRNDWLLVYRCCCDAILESRKIIYEAEHNGSAWLTMAQVVHSYQNNYNFIIMHVISRLESVFASIESDSDLCSTSTLLLWMWHRLEVVGN